METEKQTINDLMVGLPDKRSFTPKEAAGYLNVSVPTIYRWIESETIRAFHVGGRLKRIPRQSILDVVKEYDPYE